MPEFVSTAIAVAVIAAICVFAAIFYVKKLSKGCCGTGADKVHRVEAADGEYPFRYTVEVKGMSCGNCAARVENGFNRQQGMRAVVELSKGIAHVSSEKQLPELIIRKTIVDLGYSVGSITQE